MNDTFRYTLIPVILGANFKARLWADRYLRRYRVRTTVMNDSYHPSLLFPISLRFCRLRKSESYTDFILADLIRFADEHPDKLLVLIGATTHYATIIRENRSLLERYYILSDPELSFLSQAGAEAAQ
jgi:hypothetical protein